jgi:hypothetical protein
MSGWSTCAVDVILRRYVRDYARVMAPARRQAFAATQAHSRACIASDYVACGVQINCRFTPQFGDVQRLQET